MTAARSTGRPRRKLTEGSAIRTLGRAPNLPSQVELNHRDISAGASHQAFAGSLAASPNLIPGTAPTRVSWMSSTDLMKWV